MYSGNTLPGRYSGNSGGYAGTYSVRDFRQYCGSSIWKRKEKRK